MACEWLLYWGKVLSALFPWEPPSPSHAVSQNYPEKTNYNNIKSLTLCKWKLRQAQAAGEPVQSNIMKKCQTKCLMYSDSFSEDITKNAYDQKTYRIKNPAKKTKKKKTIESKTTKR